MKTPTRIFLLLRHQWGSILLGHRQTIGLELIQMSRDWTDRIQHCIDFMTSCVLTCKPISALLYHLISFLNKENVYGKPSCVLNPSNTELSAISHYIVTCWRYPPSPTLQARPGGSTTA